MRAPREKTAALCAAILLTAPAAARARDVWTSEEGDSVLELRAFYKTFGDALRMQPGLVQGTQALQDLLTEAGQPVGAALPLYGAASTHTARAWGRFLVHDKVELSVGYQLDATIASDRALAGGLGLGGSVPVAGTQAASRRLVDFDHVLARKDGFLLQHNLDQLCVKAKMSVGELVVGRQVLSWGTGHFWNPTDLLSPFGPTDVDREVRHGVDAVRFSMPLSKTALLDVLWLPQQQGWAQGAVVRAQANFKGFDVSLSAAKYVSDVVVGADAAGDIGPVAVRAEAAYTFGLTGLDSGHVDLGDHFLRAVAGLDLKPASGLVLSAEYYYNGFGAEGAAGYAGKLASARVTSGEIFGAGQHYLALAAIWKATDLLTVNAMAIGNLADPSVIVVPSLEYWLEQSVILRVGGYIPIGKQPDPRALQALTLSDLVGRTPAFQSASGSLGLRSEYGSSPWGLFAQVGVYF